MDKRWISAGGLGVLLIAPATAWTARASSPLAASAEKGGGREGFVRPGAASPGSPARPSVAARPLPPGVVVRTGAGAMSFRWSDGDWIVRVPLTLQNSTGASVDVARDVFDAYANDTPMTDWGSAATLPEVITLAPGQSVTGSAAWYYSRNQPRPVLVTVTSGGLANPVFRQSVRVQPGQDMTTAPPPVPPPAPPVMPPPPPPPAGLPANVSVVVNGPGTSFRWSDGDWIARVEVTLVNGNGGVAVVDPSVFQASAGGTAMTRWTAAATLRGTTAIPAGQQVTGTLAWYYNRALPRPSVVTVSVPAGNAPAFQRVVPTTPGPDVSATTTTPVANTTPATLDVRLARPPITFRWPDNDWIVRAEVVFTNTGPGPIVFNPSEFSAETGGGPMTRWAPASTLPATATLAPGQSLNGAVAWYVNRAQPRPAVVTLSYGANGQSSFVQTVPTVPGRNPNP